MTRVASHSRRWLISMVLASVASSIGAVGGAPDVRAQAGAASLTPEQRDWWRDKAAQLRARTAAAALREQAASAAYSRMLTRRYPAGDAKLAIIDERDAATKELAEAIGEVRDFKEQARAEGIPHHWIDPDGEQPQWWVDPASWPQP